MTLATSLACFVRRNVTIARLRGYGSATAMILPRSGSRRPSTGTCWRSSTTRARRMSTG